MQPTPLFPFRNPFLLNGELSEEAFESYRVLFLVPYLLFQGGSSGSGSGSGESEGGIGMDLSKVGEKILSSVMSATSLGLLPSTSDPPEVPARAAAAAAVARALAGLPPHQRYSLPTSSEELSLIYGSGPPSQGVEELEEGFYEEEFDPVRHILEHIPSVESEPEYFEMQASLRLAQLDRVAEQLSRHVMEHHEVMVKGMNLVRELERDLKLATVICMNGRRRLTSSMNEVSRDLIVNSNAKKKQDLMDMLPILKDLRRALEMQAALEVLVEKENYCKAFQLLSEYLQLLDSLSELSVAQEMSCGVEAWLEKTLQKLDSLLMAVCWDFKDEGYITVVDAYALIGDISGLAEKIQSFFMQEVLTETHSVLKSIVEEDQEVHTQASRHTYSDLCLQIPDSKFRQCLLKTLAVLFRLMCSYDEIMKFYVKNKNMEQNENDISRNQEILTGSVADTSNFVDEKYGKLDRPNSLSVECRTSSRLLPDSHNTVDEARDSSDGVSTSGSPWHELRKEAIAYVSQTLQRGRKNLWQLTTSRVSVLLSSSAACSTSIHQFLRNYEDLNVFILAGESFCGAEAVEFRQKLKAICENYYSAFHRQNIYALKMVLEKETWIPLPSDTVQLVSFAELVGDGAPVIVQSHNYTNSRNFHTIKPEMPLDTCSKESGFSHWRGSGNPFMPKLSSASESSSPNGAVSGDTDGNDHNFSPRISDSNHTNGGNSISEDENMDLLADFIDEDSQLPSRIAKSSVSRSHCLQGNADEFTAQTGSSLCLLRTLDKYARLMQKLELINVELFKGIRQLFEVFFYSIFETFGQQSTSSGKWSTDALNYRLRTALSKVTQDCDQWLKPLSSPMSSSSPASLNDLMPSPLNMNSSIGLKERCAGADTMALVSRIMHRSRAHLQSLLLQNSTAIVDDFYVHLVSSVPDLIEHIQRTTARQLLHINGYVDRIVNSKWELKELGMEHNGYVDLLLGEFKHYKTRITHGGIHKEVQDRLLEYGLDIVAETLVEGLSRVKRCTNEGRALMSLDLQVLINGLKHFVSFDVRPKLQIVETFIKAYYLPVTEYVHWARAHPEYSKSQIVGLINLVATMKGWKRKSRLEVLEKLDLA